MARKKPNGFVTLRFQNIEMNRKFFVWGGWILCCWLMVSCGQKHPDDFEIWGLDVSRHQKDVNWLEVAQHEKPDFVFIKATEGTLIVDPTYARHRRELEEAGITWGAYHFFGHRTSGKEQARNFIKTAGLKPGNIIPVLDIEWHRFMKDPKRSVREAKAFCDEIHRYYGTNPIIYCSTHFYDKYLKKDFSPREYVLWIADYRGAAPDLSWTLWQHTESYRIRGIGGKVDRNVFAGTDKEFSKLIL